jgi:hypothetical protein
VHSDSSHNGVTVSVEQHTWIAGHGDTKSHKTTEEQVVKNNITHLVALDENADTIHIAVFRGNDPAPREEFEGFVCRDGHHTAFPSIAGLGR